MKTLQQIVTLFLIVISFLSTQAQNDSYVLDKTLNRLENANPDVLADMNVLFANTNGQLLELDASTYVQQLIAQQSVSSTVVSLTELTNQSDALHQLDDYYNMGIHEVSIVLVDANKQIYALDLDEIITEKHQAIEDEAINASNPNSIVLTETVQLVNSYQDLDPSALSLVTILNGGTQALTYPPSELLPTQIVPNTTLPFEQLSVEAAQRKVEDATQNSNQVVMQTVVQNLNTIGEYQSELPPVDDLKLPVMGPDGKVFGLDLPKSFGSQLATLLEIEIGSIGIPGGSPQIELDPTQICQTILLPGDPRLSKYNFSRWSYDTDRIFSCPKTNVGIGLVNPSTKLHVAGRLTIMDSRPGTQPEAGGIDINANNKVLTFNLDVSDDDEDYNTEIEFKDPTSANNRPNDENFSIIAEPANSNSGQALRFYSPGINRKAIFENFNVIMPQRLVIGGTSHSGSDYKLEVQGKIRATEVMIENEWWPDYVFKKDYNLMPLNELSSFVETHHHLPNIPSEAEVEAKGGVDLGEVNRKLLEKVEELTLYVLQLNKEIELLKTK